MESAQGNNNPRYPFFYFSPLPPPPMQMNHEEEVTSDSKPLLSHSHEPSPLPSYPFHPFMQQQVYGYPAFLPTMNQPLYIRLPNGEFQMVSTTPQPPHTLYQSAVQEKNKSRDKIRRVALASLITYIVGLFTFLPHVVSVFLSLRVLKKARENFTPTKASLVILLSVMEIIGWVLCAVFSWRTKSECFEYSDQTYYASVQVICDSYYSGWIAIVVWFIVAILCGIPRVILTRQAARVKQDF